MDREEFISRLLLAGLRPRWEYERHLDERSTRPRPPDKTKAYARYSGVQDYDVNVIPYAPGQPEKVLILYDLNGAADRERWSGRDIYKTYDDAWRFIMRFLEKYPN